MQFSVEVGKTAELCRDVEKKNSLNRRARMH